MHFPTVPGVQWEGKDYGNKNTNKERHRSCRERERKMLHLFKKTHTKPLHLVHTRLVLLIYKRWSPGLLYSWPLEYRSFYNLYLFYYFFLKSIKVEKSVGSLNVLIFQVLRFSQTTFGLHQLSNQPGWIVFPGDQLHPLWVGHCYVLLVSLAAGTCLFLKGFLKTLVFGLVGCPALSYGCKWHSSSPFVGWKIVLYYWNIVVDMIRISYFLTN